MCCYVGPGDGTQLAKLPSPGRESPALGPLKSSSVMSAVLGGVRRGMESFSSEAANVIQRVTNTGKQEGEADDAYMAPGQVRYSQPPAASTSAGAGPQRAAGGFWGSDETSVAPHCSVYCLVRWCLCMQVFLFGNGAVLPFE